MLVVAGGEGMGPVEKTCSAIARASGASVQLVVVTGRNAKLAERLRLRQWPSGMHVAVQVSCFPACQLLRGCTPCPGAGACAMPVSCQPLEGCTHARPCAKARAVLAVH